MNISDCTATPLEQSMLDDLRKIYPNMTVDELRSTLSDACDGIRAGMKARGYEMPEDDDELLRVVRQLRNEH